MTVFEKKLEMFTDKFQKKLKSFIQFGKSILEILNNVGNVGLSM